MAEVTLEETTKRAIAVEGALFVVINNLVAGGQLPPKGAIEALELLAAINERSRERLREPIELLKELEKARDTEA